MYIYKCKLDGQNTFLLEYLKDLNVFVEIETYGYVVRNDGFSRKRWKLLQDALYLFFIAKNQLYSQCHFCYMQVFLILIMFVPSSLPVQ